MIAFEFGKEREKYLAYLKMSVDITDLVLVPDEASYVAGRYSDFFAKYGFGYCVFVAIAVQKVFDYKPVSCYLSNDVKEEHFINIDYKDDLIDYSGSLQLKSEFTRLRSPIKIMDKIKDIDYNDERVLYFEDFLITVLKHLHAKRERERL